MFSTSPYYVSPNPLVYFFIPVDYFSTIPTTTDFIYILLIIEKGKVVFVFCLPLMFFIFYKKRPLTKCPDPLILKEKGGSLCQINLFMLLV